MSGLLGALIGQGVNLAGNYQAGQREASQLALQQALQAMQYERAVNAQNIENALKQAETKNYLHTASRLQPGDPGYVSMMGDVAGAQENAQVPGKVAAAVQTAKGTAPIKTQQAVAQAQALEPINVREAGEKAQATLPSQIQIAGVRAGFTPRALNASAALPQLQSAEQTLAKYDAPGAAGRLFQRSALGRYGMSAEGQIATQAAEQFAHAYLNAHAVRNPSSEQIQQVVNEILVQPGEEGNTAVVQAKRSRREQMVQEISQLGPNGTMGMIGGGTAALMDKDTELARQNPAYAAWLRQQGLAP